MNPSARARRSTERGFTLVELMIVVAIIGILAAIAIPVYNKQVVNAKMTRMEQYAMDLVRGQEEFYARHNVYYPPPGTSGQGGECAKFGSVSMGRWAKALGFNHADFPADAEVCVYAGAPDTDCSSGPCSGSLKPRKGAAWYVVSASQDLDGDAATADSMVVLHRDMSRPVRLNEGQ